MIKEEAIEILSDMRAEYNIFSDNEEEATRYHALSWAIQALNEQKRTERKTGKWIRKSPTAWMWTCSCCKKDNAYAYSAGESFDPDVLQDFFCPNCGARMNRDIDG